eukprot:7324959-Pyramimonas_sp.AAC.1
MPARNTGLHGTCLGASDSAVTKCAPKPSDTRLFDLARGGTNMWICVIVCVLCTCWLTGNNQHV